MSNVESNSVVNSRYNNVAVSQDNNDFKSFNFENNMNQVQNNNVLVNTQLKQDEAVEGFKSNISPIINNNNNDPFVKSFTSTTGAITNNMGEVEVKNDAIKSSNNMPFAVNNNNFNSFAGFDALDNNIDGNQNKHLNKSQKELNHIHLNNPPVKISNNSMELDKNIAISDSYPRFDSIINDDSKGFNFDNPNFGSGANVVNNYPSESEFTPVKQDLNKDKFDFNFNENTAVNTNKDSHFKNDDFGDNKDWDF